MNDGGGCYDPDAGATTCGTGFIWLEAFVSFREFETGGVGGFTEGSATVGDFSWWAPIGKFSRVETGPCVHDDLWKLFFFRTLAL
jgi:hypothetical protein